MYTNYVTTIYVTGKELYAHTISLTVLGGSSLVTVEGSNVVIQSLGLSSRLGDNQQQPTAAEAGLARRAHSQRASLPLSLLSPLSLPREVPPAAYSGRTVDITSASRDQSVLGGNISTEEKQWNFPPWNFPTIHE